MFVGLSAHGVSPPIFAVQFGSVAPELPNASALTWRAIAEQTALTVKFSF